MPGMPTLSCGAIRRSIGHIYSLSSRYSNRGGKCYKDKLLISDCKTTETIGIGDKGEGCICVPKPTSPSGGTSSAQPCPPMESYSDFSPLNDDPDISMNSQVK
jgi:hypothetical protein